MRLVTGCNEHYYPRMVGYLNSLRKYADFPVTLVGVGFTPPAMDGIDVISITRAQNRGAPPETECIQHGSFLPLLDGDNDSEVVIYTDGDFVMQRAMDAGERAFLSVGHGEVVAGYNFGAHSTLRNDAELLGVQIGWDELEKRYGEIIHTAQDYNVGFLAMTRRTWAILYQSYMQDYPPICGVFSHMARQQWLISWEIATLGLAVNLCPWSIHAHGHGGLKPGMYYGNGGLYHDGKLALFRHHA